jgi:hypothetical protein
MSDEFGHGFLSELCDTRFPDELNGQISGSWSVSAHALSLSRLKSLRTLPFQEIFNVFLSK